MTCDRVDLSALVDGELPAGAVQAVEAHCASCATCAAELADLRVLDAALKSKAREVPPVRERAVEAAVSRARAIVTERAEVVEAARSSPWRTLAGLLQLRVSVPAPALAFGLAVVVLLLARFDERGAQVRITVVPVQSARPGARLAVHEVWESSAELWERPAVTTGGANYRVVHEEEGMDL